ncbi:hypothetical protein GCM10022251_08250 [Phytohabitans flavus]|uniref:CD-NTase-associated protein 12/Pycsar effector protein TIR domain-containing protein n=1 Tax=Phytohabitans flavus TaxID=1076124 RepID=A0A6F8Y1R4_9ACTN|nr:hypothetical protein Pflav_064030 [Phytohabitans flavus]
MLGDHDRLIERGVEHPAPRDNVIFELGLFMGRIGPSRTFFLYDAARAPKRPTDVIGVTGLSYRQRDPGSIHAGDLATTAGKIKRRARELGPVRRPTARPSVYWCAPHANVQRNRDAATILSQRGISLMLPHDLVQRSLGPEARDDPAAVRQVCLDGIRR